MKKIKFVGIATAALLALTPATTTAFASSNNNENVHTSQSVTAIDWGQVVDGVKGLINDIVKAAQDNNKPAETTKSPEQQVTDLINGLKDVNYDENHPVIISHDLLNNKLAKPLSANDFAQLLGQLKLTNEDQGKTIAAANHYQYRLSGTKSDTISDIYTKLDNLKNGDGAQVPLTIETLNTKNNNAVVNTKMIVFTNNTKTIKKTNNLKIDYNSPINVALGSNVVDVKLSGSTTSNTKVTDNNGNNVAYTAKPGELYPSVRDARNNTNKIDMGGVNSTIKMPSIINQSFFNLMKVQLI